MDLVLRLAMLFGGSLVLCLCMACPALGQQAAQKQKVILDTDIGDDIDDAYALSLALSSPELEVLGVCVNTRKVEDRAKIALKMLHEVGRDDVPVALGLRGKNEEGRPNQIPYAEDYTATQPIKEDAVEFTARLLNESQSDITVIAYGPMSNIGALVERHPMAAKRMKRLIVMGGMCGVGVFAGREIKPEYNIKSDVPAAQAMMRCGRPITLVTLDVTLLCKLTPPYLERFTKSPNKLAQALVKLLGFWPGKVPTLHDPLAVSYAVDPSLLKVEPKHVVVDDKGFTRIVEGKAPNCEVSVTVEAERFLEWFCRRIAG